jgi:hypothetical protein
MTWLGPEAIIDKTKAYILASQTAKLASITARFTTMPITTLPDFAVIRAADPDHSLEAVFPALFISPDTTEFDGAMGWGTADSRSTFIFTVMPWGLPTTDLSNAEVVRRLSMRYVLAVLEMLLDMHSHTTSTYHVGGGPIHWATGDKAPLVYYSPIYTRGDGAEYLGDARLIISCEHTEA